MNTLELKIYFLAYIFSFLRCIYLIADYRLVVWLEICNEIQKKKYPLNT